MVAKRIIAILGVCTGIAMICFGVQFKNNSFSGYGTDTTEYASFGADFYTYEYKATRIAASNAAAAAKNVRELGCLQAEYTGMAFIFAGILVILTGLYASCGNGKGKTDEAPRENRPVVTPAPVIADTPHTEVPADPVLEEGPSVSRSDEPA